MNAETTMLIKAGCLLPVVGVMLWGLARWGVRWWQGRAGLANGPLLGFVVAWLVVPWVAPDRPELVFALAVMLLGAGWLALRVAVERLRAIPEGVWHGRLTKGDFTRWAVLLLAGGFFLVPLSELGFWIYVLVAVPTLVLMAHLGVDAAPWRNERDAPRALVALVFAWMACAYSLGGVRRYYGVPVPGHFLESPSYSLEVPAKVQRLNDRYEPMDEPLHLVAKVKVQLTSERVESGENRFGETEYAVELNRALDVVALQFVRGPVRRVEMMEPADGETCCVQEPGGMMWRVDLPRWLLY